MIRIIHPKPDTSKCPLLSTAAVARWLGVSTRTVCLWAECREIPAVKVGRQWRFREEDLHRWFERTQEKSSLLGTSLPAPFAVR